MAKCGKPSPSTVTSGMVLLHLLARSCPLRSCTSSAGSSLPRSFDIGPTVHDASAGTLQPVTGTWINVATALCGGLLGLALGSRFPDKVRQTVMAGLGLVTVVIGLQLALQTKNIPIVLGSLLAGRVAGELLGIDGRLNRLAAAVEGRFSAGGGSGAFARA